MRLLHQLTTSNGGVEHWKGLAQYAQPALKHFPQVLDLLYAVLLGYPSVLMAYKKTASPGKVYGLMRTVRPYYFGSFLSNSTTLVHLRDALSRYGTIHYSSNMSNE